MAISTSLNQLAELDYVQVQQEALRPFTRNKFVVRSATGEDILTAREKLSLLGVRDYNIPVYDSHGLEVMQLRRTIHCVGPKMEVVVMGEVACVVEQKAACMRLVLHIKDAEGRTRYRIRNGPWGCLNRPMDYLLQTADKRTIGVVRKEIEGFKKTWNMRLDNYTLEFPADMDVRYKAGVIGACILLDLIVYERH